MFTSRTVKASDATNSQPPSSDAAIWSRSNSKVIASNGGQEINPIQA